MLAVPNVSYTFHVTFQPGDSGAMCRGLPEADLLARAML
jgi:hypothetical protein